MIFNDKQNNVILIRLQSRRRESLWRVQLSKNGGVLGFVYSLTDDFYPKQFGWQKFPNKIWIYSSHWGIGTGRTRSEVVKKLVNRELQIEVNEYCKNSGCHMNELCSMTGATSETNNQE